MLEETEQAQLACIECSKVQQNLPISAMATFANQKMDGQVVDINGTLCLT